MAFKLLVNDRDKFFALILGVTFKGGQEHEEIK
jgi:hypothetical protein